MSFTKGLNGLNAAAKNLEIISDNIANANTVGFKAGQLYFSEVLGNTQSQVNASNTGSGAASVSVMPQFGQGSIRSTSNALDVAVKGQGLFCLKDDSGTYFSRAGQFQLDSDGYVTTSSGARVQGFPANADGTVSVGSLGDLRISDSVVSSQATTTASMKVNVDARQPVLDPAGFRMTDPATYDHTTSLPVYDSAGDKHNVSLYFLKSAAMQWTVYAAADGEQVGTDPVGTIDFGTDGQIDTTKTTMPFSLNMPVTGKDAIAMSLDLGGSTALNSDFVVGSSSSNGQAAGQMTGYSVDSNGLITGRYSNGTTTNLGQFALAVFSNPQGLKPLGSSGFQASGESGPAKFVAANSGVAGAIQSGSLEESNVDLTAELVRMIEAQRVYQANAQAIKAMDEVMKTAGNMG